MKKILTISLMAFIPIVLSAQCYEPFTSDTASAMNLKEVIEQYIQLKLTQNEPKPISKSYTISYSDSTGFAGLSISLKREKILQGTEVIYGQPSVFRIVIYGPADRITKMANEYFLPMIEPCLKQKISCCFFWNKMKLACLDDSPHDDIPMKYIEIESVP